MQNDQARKGTIEDYGDAELPRVLAGVLHDIPIRTDPDYGQSR